MPDPPVIPRVSAYFDGQNLYYHAKEAFGYKYPNYDPLKLAKLICLTNGWELINTFFYTGIPLSADNAFWNHFWSSKMAMMGTRGIKTFSRPLRYHSRIISLPGGASTTSMIGHEKGIDVRISLDIVRHALENEYDVALIFSQDQDLSEATVDVKKIAALNNRWIKIACAFPVGSNGSRARGINATDWIKIDKTTYDSCIDPTDYRPKKTP